MAYSSSPSFRRTTAGLDLMLEQNKVGTTPNRFRRGVVDGKVDSHGEPAAHHPARLGLSGSVSGRAVDRQRHP
jgi:hypothetical protein